MAFAVGSNSLYACFLCPEHGTGHLHTVVLIVYRGADKSLARPGRKQATATEDFEFHISYL